MWVRLDKVGDGVEIFYVKEEDVEVWHVRLLLDKQATKALHIAALSEADALAIAHDWADIRNRMLGDIRLGDIESIHN